MKTRQGFVSNSSSSSFVVAFPKKPSSPEELRNMMFTSYQYHIKHYDEAVPVETICQTVYQEICDQIASASVEEVEECLRGYYYYYLYDVLQDRGYGRTKIKEEDFDTKEEFIAAMNKDYEEKDRRAAKFQKEKALEFIEENRDKFILCTEYEDHSILESIMEHGNIFRNLKYIRVSHH